jgi:hypothetical protein
MRSRSIRWWIAEVSVPLGLVAVLVALPLAFWDRLPESIARHWDLSGVPNGWSPRWVFVLLIAVLGGLAWSALISAGIRGMASKAITSVVYFLLGIFLGVTTVTVWANIDLRSGEVAQEVGFLPVLAVIAGAVVFGALGWFLSEAESGFGPEAVGDQVLTMQLDPDESAVWLGRTHSVVLTLAAGLLAGTAVVLLDAVGAVLLIVAILMFWFSAARVSVSAKGVTIGAGPWGWPAKRLALSEISWAESLDVEPLTYGGWGLRFRGLRENRTAALVVRKGPGLRLVRANQADIVVTVDNPDGGVALVNALLGVRPKAATSEGEE